MFLFECSCSLYDEESFNGVFSIVDVIGGRNSLCGFCVIVRFVLYG